MFLRRASVHTLFPFWSHSLVRSAPLHVSCACISSGTQKVSPAKKKVGSKKKKIEVAKPRVKKTIAPKPKVMKATPSPVAQDVPPPSDDVAQDTADRTPSEDVKIDMKSVLTEWESLMKRVTGKDIKKDTTVPADVSLAQRSTLVARIQAGADEFPFLYTLLNYSGEEMPSVTFIAHPQLTAEEGATSVLVSFLKFYSQLVFQNPPLLSNYRQLLSSVGATVGRDGSRNKSIPTTYAHIVLLHYIFLRVLETGYRQEEAAKAVDDEESEEVSAKGKKKKNKRKKGPDVSNRMYEANEQLCATYFSTIVSPLLSNTKQQKDGPLQKLLLEHTYWLLVSNLSKGHLAKSQQTLLAQLVKETERSVTEKLSSLLVSNGEEGKRSEVLLQMLEALLIVEEARLVLPSSLGKLVEEKSLEVVQKICTAATQHPTELEALCCREVAAAVERLRAGEGDAPTRVYSQVCTLLFAAMAHLQRSEAVLARLVESTEQKCFEVMRSMKGEEERVPQRPNLHGSATELCYVLLCCGFSSDAVVHSSLCATMTALELVDIAGAADLFSRQFASIPLPPRLHETVMQRCTSVLSQLTRDRSQAIISSQDEKMELEELSKRLKNVKAKPNTDAAPRRKKKAKKQESESDVIVLSSHVRQLVDEAFYINLNFIVELILRGDTKNAVQLISALFLGLEQEGGALYVAQAQAYIVDTLFFKLRHVGCLHAIEVAPPSPETSLAVEEALAATASALLVRVSQGLTRQLTQKATSTGETEKEHKSLGGASLLVVLVDLTASLLCCGMSADGVRQLNRLHTAILKTTLLAEGDAAVNPNTLVQKSIQTLTSIVSGFEARKLPFPRHHKSLAAQLTNLSINEIVSNHIGLLTEVIRKDDKRLTQLSLTTTLQTVKFLSNVLLQYPVTAEPSGIYSFRTEIMDPLLVTALRQKQIPLAQLSEIAFVMLREETVHLLSSEFLNRLSDRVIEASKQKGNDAHVSTSAFRLAQSFRVICQLSEAQYTQNFVRILEILDAHLTLLQCCTLLEKMLSTNGPADTPVGLRMYKRLVASLESQKVSLLLSDRILLLHAVVRYRVLYPKTATEHLVPLVTYMSKMLKRVPIRSYGALVALACDLHTVEPSAELMLLPRQVAALLLPQVQSCPIECVATTVAGYARLPESESPLKAQVLGVFISRITRVVQELSPEEITTCIEAYCKSGLFQPYFFGILLARLSDVTQLVTLEVAIRLLQCGIHSHREEIRTACITAAKPLFLIHVKTILQRDPNSLATVVTSSTLILHCLRDAFPREPVASQVLEAIALHHHVARLPIMVATLQLIAERNGADLDVLRTLAEHSCTVLIPKCGAAEFAELFSLLVQCGVRSAQLLSAAKEKLKELTSGKSSALDGHSLATLAGSLQVAFMEVDTVLLQLISEQVTAVCKKASSGKSSAAGRATPFTLRGVSVILQLYYSAGEAHVFPLQGSVDGLLHYAVQHWRTADGLATLRPNDLYVLLRACKEASSGLKPHLPLVDLCAEGIQSQLSSTDCLKQWEDMDLLHVGQLLHILLACAPRMAKHPSVKLLLELIYKKKALLLQRQLVKEEVQKVLRQCGKEAHPELWELLGMDSKSK